MVHGLWRSAIRSVGRSRKGRGGGRGQGVRIEEEIGKRGSRVKEGMCGWRNRGSETEGGQGRVWEGGGKIGLVSWWGWLGEKVKKWVERGEGRGEG